MFSIEIPLWAWLAFAYLSIGAYVRSCPPLYGAQVRAVRHYAHCRLKLYRSMVRDPWRSQTQIRKAEFLVEEALREATYLLDSLPATSALETLLFWPNIFRRAIIVLWDANELCDERRENVARRHSLRNLRFGKI